MEKNTDGKALMNCYWKKFSFIFFFFLLYRDRIIWRKNPNRELKVWWDFETNIFRIFSLPHRFCSSGMIMMSMSMMMMMVVHLFLVVCFFFFRNKNLNSCFLFFNMKVPSVFVSSWMISFLLRFGLVSLKNNFIVFFSRNINLT